MHESLHAKYGHKEKQHPSIQESTKKKTLKD